MPFVEFDLAQSRGMDLFFNLIGHLDIYAMMDIEVHTDFRIGPPAGIWRSNPYNVQNGGPCKTPADFFTNPDAKKVFKNKLRYIAARWGYSPNLFAIELWSEVETTTDYNSINVSEWHKEMLDYWDSIDTYEHLVSTSLMELKGDANLMALPSLDFTITEKYGARDIAEALYDEARMTLQEFNKPTLNVEFGLQTGIYGGLEHSPMIVHNGLWSSALSGAAGCPAYWYWDHLKKENLLNIFEPIAKYVENENFTDLHPVKIRNIKYEIPQNELIYPHLALKEAIDDSQSAMNKEIVINIPNDGNGFSVPAVPRVLYPKSEQNQAYNPTTLEVDFAADGQLVIWGHWLPDTGTAKIKVSVDGKEVAVLEYLAGDWAYRYESYENICIPRSVKVPKGKHRIVLDNIGDAWLSVKLNLYNYLKASSPNIRVYGIGNETSAYLWIQNRDNIWYNAWAGFKPRNMKNILVEIADMKPGVYIVEWWDTYRGIVSKSEQITVNASKILPISLLEIEKDIACKIRLKK